MKILLIAILTASVVSMGILLIALIGGRIRQHRELRGMKKEADLRREIDARNTAMPVGGKYTKLSA